MSEIMVNIDKEADIISQHNLTPNQNMNCGRMLKFTEVLSSYMSYSPLYSTYATPSILQNMLSTVYENESKSSNLETNTIK